jgi:hypothetical protein
VPRTVGQILGVALHRRGAVVAKDELDAGIRVPPVQVFGLREVGVATEQDFHKTGAKAGIGGLVESDRRAFMGGAVAGSIDNAQHFTGVGQADEQRMVTPGAVISDIHAFLAIARSANERAIDVDHSLLEEANRLLLPQTDADIVVDVLQGVDVGDGETPGEIASRGGIRNPLGTERIEEVDIVAAPFDILHAGAVAQGIEGEVQDVIGLEIRKMDFEDVEPLVDGVDESNVLSEFVQEGDAAASDAGGAFREGVAETGAAAKDGLGTVGEFGFVESALDFTLACGELAVTLALVSAAFGAMFMAATLGFVLASGAFVV